MAKGGRWRRWGAAHAASVLVMAMAVTAELPSANSSSCYKYCRIMQPLDPGAEGMQGVARFYQTPLGAWAGVDLLISNDFLIPPEAPTVSHIHLHSCSFDFNQNGVWTFDGEQVLQVSLEPDPVNHRNRTAQFDKPLPPLGTEGLAAYIVHNADGSAHACCDLRSCAPPENAVCLGYGNQWTIVDPRVGEISGAITVSSYDGRAFLFIDLRIVAAPILDTGAPAPAPGAPGPLPDPVFSDALVDEAMTVDLVFSDTKESTSILAALPVTGVQSRIGEAAVAGTLSEAVDSGTYTLAIRDSAGVILAEDSIGSCPDLVPVRVPTEAPVVAPEPDAVIAPVTPPPPPSPVLEGDGMVATPSDAATEDAQKGGKDDKHKKDIIIVGVLSAVAAVLLLAASIAAFVWFRKPTLRQHPDQLPVSGAYGAYGPAASARSAQPPPAGYGSAAGGLGKSHASQSEQRPGAPGSMYSYTHSDPDRDSSSYAEVRPNDGPAMVGPGHQHPMETFHPGAHEGVQVDDPRLFRGAGGGDNNMRV